MLVFVQQLHNSESERKRLRQAAESLVEMKEELRHYEETCSELDRELGACREQVCLYSALLCPLIFISTLLNCITYHFDVHISHNQVKADKKLI